MLSWPVLSFMLMSLALLALVITFLLTGLLVPGPTEARYFGQPHCQAGRDVLVHLFEWKWTDIAKECEDFLADAGFCAVQVSPPMEHRIVTSPPYPWWQRYQPVSYKMGSRSGTEAQFVDMVERCNNRGVRIYVDALINHMTAGGSGIGSAGSSWSATSSDDADYPAVPWTRKDFNDVDNCPNENMHMTDSGDKAQVRNCFLLGMRDLRLNTEYCRNTVASYMNKLIDWGVAGFRVDAAKHMWPGDLTEIYGRLNNLNTRWFPAGTEPFIFGELIHLAGGGDQGWVPEYTPFCRVTEFRYGTNLGEVVRKWNGQKLAYLKNYGEGWGFMNGLDAVAFTDNHDNQRGHGGGGDKVLTFWDSSLYKVANAFMLAWDYGYIRLMSSYRWTRDIGEDGKDKNDWMGPPSDGNGNTNDVQCFDDWVCEHRWREITNMVRFHNTVVGEPVLKWWDNGENAICFARGSKGFIVINNEVYELTRNFDTNLPEGKYCDVISCDNVRPPCGSGGGSCNTVTVDSDGWAELSVPSGNNAMVAIHV